MAFDSSPIDVFALIKFSHNEALLDDLVAGTIYANTPEYYRLHDAPGIRDHHESVAFAYRQKRKDPKPQIFVADRELTDVISFTVRFGGQKDAWLHCWTALTFPPNERALREMARDFRRLQTEFGAHYVVVPHMHIGTLTKRLAALTAHKVTLRAVAYSDELRDSSPVCKRLEYQYQREVRFLIGECRDHEVKPLILKDPTGFRDLMAKDVDVSMIERDTGRHMLDMRGPLPISCMLD